VINGKGLEKTPTQEIIHIEVQTTGRKDANAHEQSLRVCRPKSTNKTKGKPSMLCSKCNQSFDSLTDQGICTDCYAEADDRRLEIIELAREQREIEGAVEIDDNALLSEGNANGCYLAAWVWVDFARTNFDKDKGKNNEPTE
jgi:hypothetical protein